MNVNTGQIYDSYESALAAGEDERDLVSAVRRETLEELRERLNLHGKYIPHQGAREQKRRRRQVLESLFPRSARTRGDKA